MAYTIHCDGYPILDLRDDSLIVNNPKVKLEVNTVGEASFTIYSNHPYYNNLQKLKSVFEIADEQGVIFRGRMTGDTMDFEKGKAVDLEGAMAFFNDSLVRPFNFPEDFLDDPAYITAAESGNVIEFFLKWQIDNHNSQVQEFQRFKMGRVTVADPNNYLSRSSTDYASTWETLKGKLFDSALGGYLCIRYEEDGNYIDYLSEFESTNTQGIKFGKNLLDLINTIEASATYTAVMALGAEIETENEDGSTTKHTITLADFPDNGNITDDIVKDGDTIYSVSGVAKYGWIYAPVKETTWDDVTEPANLLTKSVQWLEGTGIMLTSTIEATAVDLHFTDEEIQSLRIYQNVEVWSEQHGLSETYPITKLEITLLQPQNTKITAGATVQTLTDRTAETNKNLEGATSEFKNQLDQINKVVSETKVDIVESEKRLTETFTSEIEQFADSIELSVEGSLGSNARIILSSSKSLQNVGLDLTKVRESFANDETAIAISAGTITFNSGTIVINSNYFNVTSAGVITATSGTIGAITLSTTGIYSHNSSYYSSYAGWYKPNQITTDSACFFAGASDQYGTNAKFAVTYGGVLTANEAEINGTITTENGSYIAKLGSGGLALYWNDGLCGTINSRYFYNATDSGLSLRVEEGGQYLMFSHYDPAYGSEYEIDYILNCGWSDVDFYRHLFYTSVRFFDTVYFSGKVLLTQGIEVYRVSYKNDDWSTPIDIEMLSLGSYGGKHMLNLGDSDYLTLIRGSTVYLRNTSTTLTSDRNAKNSIEALPDEYEAFFDALEPVRFKYNEGTSGRYHVGYIAQDVESALFAAGLDSMAFAGYVDIEKSGELGLMYDEFIALLHQKIKRLERRIAVLEQQ